MATFNVVVRQMSGGQFCFSKCIINNIGNLSKTLDTVLLKHDNNSPLLGFHRHKSTAFPLLISSPKLSSYNSTSSSTSTGTVGRSRTTQLHHQRNLHSLVLGQKLISLNLLQLPLDKSTLCFARLSSDSSKVKTDSEEAQNFATFARKSSSDSASSSTESSSSDSGKDGPKDGENGEKKGRFSRMFSGKNSWKIGLVFMLGSFASSGGMLIYSWGAPLLDPDGNPIEDEFTGKSFETLRRTWKEMNIFKKSIADPSREKLLPEPLKYPYMQPPYTLVMELKDVLIHPDWTYNTGWRFKKRPALDYFLSQVGPPLFEVVIYSSETGMTLDPIVSQLDPQGFIMYRLYRDATRYMDNHHVKDLSCLNRDESRIIIIDSDSESVKLQPKNALVLDKWSGGDEDRKLIDLAHFLKTIAASGVEDVRPVLEYYHKFDDPLEAFKENQRKFQEEQDVRAKQAAEESKKKSWLSTLSGKR